MRDISLVFGEDMQRQLSALSDAVAGEDFQHVMGICHTVSGAAGNIGGMALSATAQDLQLVAKTQDLRAVRDGIKKMADDFARLQVEMNTKLG